MVANAKATPAPFVADDTQLPLLLSPAGEPEQVTAVPPPSPFDDLNSLRMDQNFEELSGVERLITTIPVGKPTKREFVRVHPGEDYRMNCGIIELKEEGGDAYFVSPTIGAALSGEFTLVTLYTAVTRQGTTRLWPVPLPSPDGRVNSWHEGQRLAVARGMTRWIRLVANLEAKGYDLTLGAETLPEPVFPKLSFSELLKIAFRDKFVDRLDHPLIMRLRGLV
jgi:hypothetical protein